MQNNSKEGTAFIFTGQTLKEEQQVIIWLFLTLEDLYVMNPNSQECKILNVTITFIA